MFVTSYSSNGIQAFAASVVHEVRTPLSSLRLCVEGLACAEGLTERDKRRVELAIGQIDYLEDLTDQMRSLTRRNRIASEPTALNSVVRQVGREMEKEAKAKGIRVQVSCDPRVWKVEPGRSQIRCVLTNLCLNGLQAMASDGLLSITTRFSSSDCVEVVVQDTGCGIPGSEIPRIFNPYFTTKSDGTGMGLAIVKAVVEAYDGHVEVKTEIGRGTTVAVSFKGPHQEASNGPGSCYR